MTYKNFMTMVDFINKNKQNKTNKTNLTTVKSAVTPEIDSA